jgi:hypothetical protein
MVFFSSLGSTGDPLKIDSRKPEIQSVRLTFQYANTPYPRAEIEIVAADYTARDAGTGGVLRHPCRYIVGDDIVRSGEICPLADLMLMAKNAGLRS